MLIPLSPTKRRRYREEYLHYFLNQYYLINNKIAKVGTSVTIEINVFYLI